MEITVHTLVEEQEIAKAIRDGDLQLALLLEHVFEGSDETAEELGAEIIHDENTHRAGQLAERFARMMQET